MLVSKFHWRHVSRCIKPCIDTPPGANTWGTEPPGAAVGVAGCDALPCGPKPVPGAVSPLLRARRRSLCTASRSRQLLKRQASMPQTGVRDKVCVGMGWTDIKLEAGLVQVRNITRSDLIRGVLPLLCHGSNFAEHLPRPPSWDLPADNCGLQNRLRTLHKCKCTTILPRMTALA